MTRPSADDDALLVEPGEMPTVRSAGEGEPRLLTFAAREVTIEVEVGETRSAKHIVGQIVPVTAVRLWLRAGGAGEGVECPVDRLGRFVAELPTGPQRLAFTCLFEDGETVETAEIIM